MKKLVLVLAIVFAFGVTFAVNMQTTNPDVVIEQVTDNDEKEKKEAKKEKSECSKDKKCCSEKKCCDKKKECKDKK